MIPKKGTEGFKMAGAVSGDRNKAEFDPFKRVTLSKEGSMHTVETWKRVAEKWRERMCTKCQVKARHRFCDRPPVDLAEIVEEVLHEMYP